MSNIGNLDSIIRIVLALTFLVLFIFGVIPGFFGIFGFIIAGFLMVTSMSGFCPLYYMIGWNTDNEHNANEA